MVRYAVWLVAFGSLATSAVADPSLVSLGAGATDVLNRQARTAADFRFEYRSGVSLLSAWNGSIRVKPWTGVEATSRASVWGGAGFLIEIAFGQHWIFSPSVGVGLYERGRGKNLGSVAEFRSQIEGGYVFNDQSRLVASFSHTSNAGIGKINPGTEAVNVSFQIPLSRLIGQ